VGGRTLLAETVLDVLHAVKAGVDVRIRGWGMPVVRVRVSVRGVRTAEIPEPPALGGSEVTSPTA
jgi:antitoxin (DNA-binding transcriptional repressor) of toxin-antitoxin stability system